MYNRNSKKISAPVKSEQNIDLGLTIKPTIAHKEESQMDEASYVQETKLVPNGVREELLEKYRHKIITTEEMKKIIGERPPIKEAIMYHGTFDLYPTYKNKMF